MWSLSLSSSLGLGCDSHPSPYSLGECMCGIHQENIQAWMLDHYSKRIWWLCYAVGGILSAWFVSACPLRGKGHCKSIQLFWLITFTLWWNISILMGVLSSRMTMSPPTGHRGHWMVWRIWKWCESYAMVQSPDHNPTEHLWSTHNTFSMIAVTKKNYSVLLWLEDVTANLERNAIFQSMCFEHILVEIVVNILWNCVFRSIHLPILVSKPFCQ